MSRLYGLLDDPKTINFLLAALKDAHLDKSLVVGCLRSLGISGLMELLQILQESKEKDLKIRILETLTWRNFYEDIFKLRFRVIEYQKNIDHHWIPGSMFYYKGSTKPPHSLAKTESGPTQLHYYRKGTS